MKFRVLPSELSGYLNGDERIVWAGQPKQGILFRKSDYFQVPFSLLWLGFALFWMYSALKTSLLFSLFGIPFVFVGLMFAIGRFFVDAKTRANTVYGLTENRVIIKSGLFKPELHSVDLQSLTNLGFTEHADGSGSIDIGPKNPIQNLQGMSWWPGVKATPQLELIPNVRQVYNMMLDLKKHRSTDH